MTERGIVVETDGQYKKARCLYNYQPKYSDTKHPGTRGISEIFDLSSRMNIMANGTQRQQRGVLLAVMLRNHIKRNPQTTHYLADWRQGTPLDDEQNLPFWKNNTLVKTAETTG